jgi:malonyl-CoA decarboxylase
MLGDLLHKVSDIGRALTPVEDRLGELGDRCEALLLGRGEATGLALGREILDRYQELTDDEKRAFFHEMMQRFGVDEVKLTRAIETWREQNNHDIARQIHFASEPRSQELIRLLNRAPGGTQNLVRMRCDLLLAMKKDPELRQLDDDFSHLLGSWFNRGFLELRRIDWNNTPALLLEKIISYEAVHEINGWDELRLRVAAQDRRLYGFFHPSLGAEPLIFVEVALTSGIPNAIAPILAGHREMMNPSKATTAAFYSISNCQKGLRGISFGNFLIKQVVEELRREFPNLTTFVTLSPLPGMRRWALEQLDKDNDSVLPEKMLEQVRLLDSSNDKVIADQQVLKELAARYLLEAKQNDGGPLNAVARFHLGNGARLEQINVAADMSARGVANSWGVMVNYLYDLNAIEKNHEAFVNNHQIICSHAIKRLLK